MLWTILGGVERFADSHPRLWAALAVAACGWAALVAGTVAP